jgi:hypothetical protein
MALPGFKRKKILKKNQIAFLQEKQQFYKLFKQESIARPLVNKFWGDLP